MPATLGWADAIIADSEHTKGDIVELLGIAPARITVVHLAPAPGLAPPAEGAAVRSAALPAIQQALASKTLLMGY